MNSKVERRMPTPKAENVATSLVRELADILNETGLSEIEVERDGQRIRVAKSLTQGFVQAYAPAPAPAASATAAPAVEADHLRGSRPVP